jgi:SAM-dependent methyltransferase
MRGTPPHTIGYQFYKRRMIQKYLSPGVFIKAIDLGQYGLHLDERVIEYPWLFSRLPENDGRLLDAGSALNFGYLLSHERLACKQIFISTLSPEVYSYWRRGISYVFEDLRQTCYCENYFDWVACISTIEHIGLDNYMLYTKDQSKLENRKDDYLRVISEMRRVLKPGGKLFLTFPFGKYRNHGWFQIFDADMVEMVRETFAPTHAEESFFKYDTVGWRKAKSLELHDSEFFDVHAKRRLDSDCAAAARGLACLELTK